MTFLFPAYQHWFSITCAETLRGCGAMLRAGDRLYGQLGVQLAMPISGESPRQLGFGEFKLDLHTAELSTDGHKSALSDKPFQLLIALLERPGQLVTREELKQRLWNSDTFVDFDLSLNKTVNRLREALGDSSEQPRFIETLPRRGYRFVAELVPVEAGPEKRAVWKDRAPHEAAQNSGRRIRARYSIALVALLVGILGGVYAARHFWVAHEAHFHQLTFRRGTVFSARFSPEGRTVLYSAAWDGNASRMFSNHPESPESIPLGSGKVQILAISKLGEMAVLLERNFVAHRQFVGTLARAPLSGGAPREIADDVTDADWTPDGNGLALVRTSGGRYRIEFPIGKVLYETNGWISDLRFSRNGDLIAFVDHHVFPDDGGAVAVVDWKGNKRVLSDGWNSVEGLAWSVAGDQVWFAAGALYAVTLSGNIRTVLRTGTDITLHDISATGEVLLSEDNKAISMMLSTPDSRAERDFTWLKSSVVTGMSQDGKRLLFSEQYAGGGPSYSVYLRNVNGSDAVRLGRGGSLGLSADGKWAAVSLSGSSGNELWILPTGAGTPKRLPDFGIRHYYAADFVPRSRRILLSGEIPGHKPCFYLLDTEDGGFRRLTPEGTYGAASWSGNIVSPNGKSFFAKDTNQNLWVYPIDDGNPRLIGRIDPADIPFQWSPDGSAVFLYRQGVVPSKVYRMSISSGRMEVWKELNPADSTGVLAVIAVVSTTDGRSYAYSFDRWLSDLYLVDGLK